MFVGRGRVPLRSAMHILVAASAAVGVVCAGTGLGSAVAEVNSSATGVLSWRVHNFTDQELTGGTFRKWDEDQKSSFLKFSTLKPGEVHEANYVSGSFLQRNYTEVRGVCYKNQKFATEIAWTSGEKWRDVFVFADANVGLFLTHQGGGHNITMVAIGPC